MDEAQRPSARCNSRPTADLPVPTQIVKLLLMLLPPAELASLMLTCRALYSVALDTPELWQQRTVPLRHQLHHLPRYARRLTVHRSAMPNVLLALICSPHMELHCLRLNGPDLHLTATEVELLAQRLPNLCELTVPFNCIRMGDQRAFSHLSALNSLETLRLCQTLTDSGAEHVAQLSRLSQLAIGDIGYMLSSTGVARFTALTGLQVLSLCGVTALSVQGGAGLRLLLQHLTRLHTLELAGCELGNVLLDSSVWGLLGALPSLTHLDLTNNQLSSEAAAHLTVLHSNLQYLDVSSNPLQHVHFLSGLPGLHTLVAKWCKQLRDWQGLTALTGLTKLSVAMFDP